MQAQSSCYEACKTAAASLRDVQQALNACRIAARCVYFRQLLSAAAQAELAMQLPEVSGHLAGDFARPANVLCYVRMHVRTQSAGFSHTCTPAPPILELTCMSQLIFILETSLQASMS